jgi:hypothetical protein
MMDPATLITILGGIVSILGFLYFLFIGQKSLPEWLAERRAKSSATSPPKPNGAPIVAPPARGAAQMLLRQRLGGYEIREQIGAGGMGTVYKAWQASMERFVAIKVLPDHLARDEQFLQRFRREAKAIAQLEHPHILPAYDFGEQNGVLYIAMRYISGGTLRDQMADGPMPISAITRLATQIGGALDHAHQRGIIHRDLKPGNILLSPEGDAFLSDFGLARLVTTQPVSGTGAIGTPAYMSPEQGQGLPADARSDIYALGILLFEMATGLLPYSADTPLGLILKHINEPLPRPRHLNPNLPEAFEQAILKATAKSPADRFQTAGQLAAALTGISGGRIDAMRPPEPEIVYPPAVEPAPDLWQTPTADLPAFIAGPPITHPARFFGREREIKRIFGLLKRAPLQNAAIIGPRRSGKTSLLYYLKHITRATPAHLRPGQRADWLTDAQRYRWVLVDFQDPRFGHPEELLRYLLLALSLPVPMPCDLDRFLSVMGHQITQPTVLLFDEIGVALQRYPQLDNAFWEGLRSLATHQANGQLAFVLASHAPPEQLAHASGMRSPFFNIFGYSTTLGPFTEAETHDLLASAPHPIPAEAQAWMLRESGRWPLLLQILAREYTASLDDGAPGNAWQTDALHQLRPFRHLLETA